MFRNEKIDSYKNILYELHKAFLIYINMYAIKNPDIFRENVRTKLEPMIDDHTLCINTEKGIYNYAIKEANNRKIIKKWDNPYFTQIYVDRLRSIYLNLKNIIPYLRGEYTDVNI